MAHETAEFKRDLRRAFGQALRRLREKHEHQPTQEQLAISVGFDRSYWGDLERGERTVTLHTLWRLAQALSISPSRFVLAIDREYRHLGKQSLPPPSLFEGQVKRLRDFMDESPEMKWLADTRQGAIYCNRPLRDFVGVEHLNGLAWQELFHPDDLAKYLVHSKQKFARREPYLYSYRLRCAGGKYRAVVQHAVPQFTPKGIFIGYLGTMIEDPKGNNNS